MRPPASRSSASGVGEILRYGAYLPRYRAPLGEIQKFYGRPGRPRAKALVHPGPRRGHPHDGLRGRDARRSRAPRPPATVIAVSQSPPFGLRKLSATLARTLGLDDVTPLDVGGHPGALLDALEIASALAAGGGPPTLVVASDHLVCYEERVCDTLSAGAAAAFLVGASGGVARLGAVGARRARGLRRLAPGHRARGPLPARGALRRLRRQRRGGPGRPRAPDRAADRRLRRRLRQPAPPPDPARPGQGRRRRRAARGHELRGGDRQPRARPRSAWPWRWASTRPSRASTCSRSATAAARRSPRTSR